MSTNPKRSAKKGRREATPKGRRRGAKPRHASLRWKTILVPVDFSEYSRRALAYAAGLARNIKAELILLHVVESFPIDRFISPEALENDTNARLKGAQHELQALAEAFARNRFGRNGQMLRSGRPYEQIIEVAKAADVDSIILGSHGYTGLQRVYLGSTAERVVRHAPCDVLVVRE